MALSVGARALVHGGLSLFLVGGGYYERRLLVRVFDRRFGLIRKGFAKTPNKTGKEKAKPVLFGLRACAGRLRYWVIGAHAAFRKFERIGEKTSVTNPALLLLATYYLLLVTCITLVNAQ